MAAWLITLILATPWPGTWAVPVRLPGRPESIHAILPWPVEGLYEIGR